MKNPSIQFYPAEELFTMRPFSSVLEKVVPAPPPATNISANNVMAHSVARVAVHPIALIATDAFAGADESVSTPHVPVMQPLELASTEIQDPSLIPTEDVASTMTSEIEFWRKYAWAFVGFVAAGLCFYIAWKQKKAKEKFRNANVRA